MGIGLKDQDRWKWLAFILFVLYLIASVLGYALRTQLETSQQIPLVHSAGHRLPDDAPRVFVRLFCMAESLVFSFLIHRGGIPSGRRKFASPGC